MGDALSVPFEVGTPEYDQYVRGMVRAPLVTSSLAPGMLAQVLPAGKDEQGNVHATLPGMVTAAYGGLGSLIPMATNYIAGKLGYQTNLQPWAGAESANKQYEDTSRLAKSILPTEKLAENEEEQRMHDAVFSAGGMVSPIPGAAVSGLAKALPTGLQTVAKVAGHMAVPTQEGLKVGAPVMGALTAEAGDYFDPIHNPFDAPKEQPKQVAGDGGTTTLPFSIASNGPVTMPGAANVQRDPFDDPNLPPSGTTYPPNYGAEGQSGWTYGQGALTALGLAAGAWIVLKHGGKILEPLRTFDQWTGGAGEAARVADFNANLDKIDSNAAGRIPRTSLSGGPEAGEAPLPGQAGTLGTRIANKLWDSNRVTNAFTDAIAPTPELAKAFEATTGMTENSSALSRRIAAQMRTGVDQATGRQMQSLYGIVTDIDKLNPGQQEVLDWGLWARNELDSRNIKLNQAKNTPGASLADEDLRNGLYKDSSDTLRSARDLMMNDPMVASIADRIKTMQLQHIDNMELRGRITSQVANMIRNTRPNYLSSVDENGRISHTFGERDLTTWGGFRERPTTAINAIVQHYDAVYKDMARNEWQRNIILNAVKWQNADPARARVFTEKLGPADPKTGARTSVPLDESERGITIHTASGPRSFYVDNTSLYHALNGGNARMGMVMNGMSAMRNAYQQGTTGVSAALLAQQPFAAKNLLRNALQIGTDRTAGTYGGMIDKYAQRAGLKTGYTGFDPTTLVGSIAEAGRGAAAVTARNLGDMLKTQSAPITQTLRGVKGDAWVDALADRLQNIYGNSMSAERHNLGIGGGGSFGLNEPKTFQMGTGLGGIKSSVVNPLADVAPGVFRDGLHIPGTNVEMPGTKGVVSQYINLRTMLRDIHAEVNEGANSYYYRINRDNPNLNRTQLGYEVNRILGDPSMAGTAMQTAGKIIPYLNPTIQDAVRMARNFRDNPASFALGTVSTLTTLALASTLTAMLGGKDHVDHLENKISTQQREANGIFYHDPSNPNNHTEISLPQRWRFMYPYILEAVATGIGAFEAHGDEGTLERLVHTVGDFFAHHIQSSTITSGVHGIGDMIDVTVPPFVGVPLAAAGYQMQSPVSTLLNNAIEGNPLNSGLIRQFDKQSKAPGTVRGDTMVSHDDGRWAQQVLSSILGASGKAYATFFDVPSTRMHEGASMFNAFGGMVSDAGQNFRDNAPYGNFIWGNNVKQSQFNPLEESVTNRLNKLHALQSPEQFAGQGYAATGGAPPVVVTKPSEKPTDPTMMQMYGVAHNTYGTLAPFLKMVGETKTQMAQINEAGYAAQDKRSLLNQLTEKLNQQYATIDAHLKGLNGALSQIAGGRHVDIGGNINWQGDVTQFHY